MALIRSNWPESERALIRETFGHLEKHRALAECCRLLPHHTKDHIRDWAVRNLGLSFNRRQQLTHAAPPSDHCQPGPVPAVRTHQGWRCGKCRNALYSDWDNLPRCISCGSEARRP